jgi:predicted nucleic acid-binding protein
VTAGLTLDTGALIALERRRQRMARIYAVAVADRLPVTVPAVVIAEWWRGRTEARAIVLRGVRVEHTTTDLARVAGATAIDAIVMASAASRGDVVCTSDFDDLHRLTRFFPAVRLLTV